MIYIFKGILMKNLPLATVYIAAVFTMSSAIAGEVNIGLNDNVVSTDFIVPVAENVNTNLGYIYSDDRGHLAQFGMHMTHDAGVNHFEVGAKLSRLWAKSNEDATVLSFGGKYALDLGSNISLRTSGYYTPTVLAFSHADGHYEVDAKVQYDLTHQMGLYVGYRYIRFQFDNVPNRTFDNGFYAGFKARF